MSSNTEEVNDPVAKLHMQPARSILKSKRSIDDPKQDFLHEPILASVNHCPTTAMTRSESKSHKIPHFDEMNIIATYHPVDKDYGHMKIEEPKTPYAPNDIIDEEILPEATTPGIDPHALAQKLNQSRIPSLDLSQPHYSTLVSGASIDDDVELSAEELEHRKYFESHRKQHYNEFEVVRLRKKEIEDELRALEQEEQKQQESNVLISHESENEGNGNQIVLPSHTSVDSIKPILVHHSRESSASSGSHHHVHVEDDHDDQLLTPEERERKRQFELKRKKHYNEFRVAYKADQSDDEPEMTG